MNIYDTAHKLAEEIKKSDECVQLAELRERAYADETNRLLLEEYKRRHRELWQGMRDVLDAAGIVNYTIWNVGNELFGYYECRLGVAHAARVQAESPVVARWNEYMKDVMTMDADPETGAQPKLTEVFAFRTEQEEK